MAHMAFPNRTGLLSRLWQALSRAAEPAPPPAPLFKSRAVPPPPPRGPGLPPLDEILREAPPVFDPQQRRLALVPDTGAGLAATPPAEPAPAEPAPAEPAPAEPAQAKSTRDAPDKLEVAQAASVPAGPDRASPARTRRDLTAAERQAAERVRALIGAGLIGEAKSLLEAQFRDRPELTDRAGLPIHLLESFRCAVAVGDGADIMRLAGLLRPLLAEHDPLLECIVARQAVRRRDRIGARSAWQAALARAPGLPEALDWLNRNPVTPDGGIAASELISGPRPLLGGGGLPPALPQLPDVLPDGAPAELLRRVAVRLDGAAPATDGDWEAAREIPGAGGTDMAIVLRDPDDVARAPVFLETALTLFALSRSAPMRITRLYAGRQPWASRASTALQPELLAILFPGLRVVGAFDGAVREHGVLALDATRRAAATGSLFGDMLPFVAAPAAEARARVFAAYGIAGTEQPPRGEARQRQALYLQATPARALADPARDRLLALLAAAGYAITVADMATLKLREQVRLAQGADLLVGVHGPALGCAFWAHARAQILELFPPGVRRYETQLLAEVAGLSYLGIEGLEHDGYVTQNNARPGPPAGNPGGIVETLPWARLEQALRPA